VYEPEVDPEAEPEADPESLSEYSLRLVYMGEEKSVPVKLLPLLLRLASSSLLW